MTSTSFHRLLKFVCKRVGELEGSTPSCPSAWWIQLHNTFTTVLSSSIGLRSPQAPRHGLTNYGIGKADDTSLNTPSPPLGISP